MQDRFSRFYHFTLYHVTRTENSCDLSLNWPLQLTLTFDFPVFNSPLKRKCDKLRKCFFNIHYSLSHDSQFSRGLMGKHHVYWNSTDLSCAQIISWAGERNVDEGQRDEPRHRSWEVKKHGERKEAFFRVKWKYVMSSHREVAEPNAAVSQDEWNNPVALKKICIWPLIILRRSSPGVQTISTLRDF